MDDDCKDLEAELRRLRPAAFSSEFQAALERRLTRARRARILRWSGLAVPLAAAAAVMLLFQSPPPAATKAAPSTSAPAKFKPVAAQAVLLDSRDEGYVTLTDGRTARRVRQTYLDRITWKNPRTNASLTWSVPREEVRITPVSYE
jgi:hypothetical protein